MRGMVCLCGTQALPGHAEGVVTSPGKSSSHQEESELH